MKIQILFIIYLIVCGVHLYACLPPERRLLRVITKPMLMPLLALCLCLSVRPIPLLVVSGLLLGFLGDTFLISNRRVMFTVGASCFGLGHVLYIVWFLTHSEPAGGKPGVLIPVACLYSAVLFLLSRDVSKKQGRFMFCGSVAYFALLSVMSLCALAFALGTGSYGWICYAGSLLFMISDGFLIYSRLVRKVPVPNNLVIMATYIPAQTCIALGVLLLLRG